MSTALRLEAEAKYPKNLAGGAVDHQAWAKRIVYRFEHGDRDISKIQIAQAREAIKAHEPGEDL